MVTRMMPAIFIFAWLVVRACGQLTSLTGDCGEQNLNTWDVSVSATSTVTSFVTVSASGTITSFYNCFNQLPFCSAVYFGTNAGSLTSPQPSGATAVPSVGQPVTLSVTGSDGIPLAAELSASGQLLLVDASASTNATVLFADENGFLRVYNDPSLVLFLGSWTSSRAGRFGRRQSTDGVSQIQSINETDLTSSDKAGNFSFGSTGAIQLNVDGVENNFYKSDTTGETQLYTADEGVDPGSEFDGVTVVPVIQDDLPSFSSSSSSAASSTTSSQDSSSSTGVDTSSSSRQQTTTTSESESTTGTASSETASETTSEDATTDAEGSTTSEDSSVTDTSGSSTTAFTGSCPTDTANPTVFASITGDGYEAVRDVISVGGAFYTCWCSSFLNLFAASRTIQVTSTLLDLSTLTSTTVIVEEETSITSSVTGVIRATTTSYVPWPSRTRRRIPRQESISTPDILTRFAASNITAGCNIMVSYPSQSTIEEVTTVTGSESTTVILDETTTTTTTETTEFYMSTSTSVIVATPSSYSGTLGWRRGSGSLSYLEDGTISNSIFELEVSTAPAGQFTLDDTGRLVFPITDSGTTTNWYATAPTLSGSTPVTLKFATEATVASNGWEYIGFFPDRNTVILDSSQSAGGYNGFALCIFSGSTAEILVLTVDDARPSDATYCDYRAIEAVDNGESKRGHE
ncbi:hypothetical protein TWF481_010690 [Arthrobotrys musiformis]|uniref:Uncharacterized protein n=1 Tax=Arthrobotrys musiformis TaxID=47236 RepID=A0AAV9W3N6_9PEZI